MSSERQRSFENEIGSYRFINCTDDLDNIVTPEEAMEVFKQNPQDVFPFPIDGLDGDNEVEIGKEYSLRPIFVDSERVTVDSETPTSFSFVSQKDHIRGDDARLTFTTIQNEEGDLCLMQDARFRKNIFTPLLDFGSKVMWKIQTERLERVLRKIYHPSRSESQVE